MRPREDPVRRALEYPYAAPPRSYVLSGDETLALGATDVELAGRTSLLAYGSNAAPQTLRRKLGAEAGPVAAVRARLAGFDAVYSAHVTAYGAVPATLWRSPGAALPVFVLAVDETQLGAI